VGPRLELSTFPHKFLGKRHGWAHQSGRKTFALPPDLTQSRTKGIMGVEYMSEEKKRKEKSKVNPLVSLVPFAGIVLLGWDIIETHI